MSPIAFVLLLLGVALAQPDPARVSGPLGCLKCTKRVAPVCGRDGKTYRNRCKATCRNVKVACDGECPCRKPPGCACDKILAPVCGTDGKTYNNACLARCGGAKVECKRACPCPPPSTPSDINEFLEECEKTGEAASVAAASAACSTVLLKCPVSPPVGVAKASSFNPIEAFLEKVLEGACLVKAETACKSKAIDNISDKTCLKILKSKKCSGGDPGQIFKEEVEKLCKRK